MNKAHSAIWRDAKRSNEWAGDAFVRYRITDLKKSDRKRVKKYVPFSLIAHAMLLGLFLPRNVLECGGNQHLPSLPMVFFLVIVIEASLSLPSHFPIFVLVQWKKKSFLCVLHVYVSTTPVLLFRLR